jgi:acyl-CoA reductase-like NAD-dependent aldehyde dehydrogenase
VGRAHRVAGAIKSGVVTVNTAFTAFPGIPFGGYKQSGFGREMGMEALELYTELKSVLMYVGEKPLNPFGV